ncbi:hypothetical protein C8R46DRAFT_1076469 [Mycena filopes]|nr:hypothetical protein C8R46DRAFT_1076469 [Mycena filopes]
MANKSLRVTPVHGATEQQEIACSSVVAEQWDDFHSHIRPLLTLPSLQQLSKSALYADLLHRVDTQKMLWRFADRVSHAMADCYRNVYTTEADEETIFKRLTTTALPLADPSYFELRILQSMMTQLVVYFAEVKKRVLLSDERCSWWDKVLGMKDYALSPTMPVALSMSSLPSIPAMIQDSTQSQDSSPELGNGTDGLLLQPSGEEMHSGTELSSRIHLRRRRT